MLLTFLKLSIRKIWKERSFTFLSVAGLSLAAVSSTIILLYVSYERSFDNFRPGNIYRVTYHGFEHGVETGKSAQVVPALAPALKQDIPEVKSAVRLAHTAPFMADPAIEYNGKSFRESRIYFADKEFLSMFSYNMLNGNAATALTNPFQVVMSESSAKKYFGNDNPVGKTVLFHRGERGTKELMVTGVFKDIPTNSHFHTDFVISFESLQLNLDGDWDWGNFYTYIQTDPNVDQATVQSKIPALLNKHVGKRISDFATAGYHVEFWLQPIQSIHLESNLWAEIEVNGNGKTVTFLLIIAVFILFIGWINYLNFSIARSSENSREISIRKINGSSRTQLIFQLLTDSALINLISILISVALIQAMLPVLKVTIGLPESLSFNLQGLSMLAIIFLAGTICSGVYPALFISRLNPINLLRARISKSALTLNLNKALIVFQFAATAILVIATITVYKQLSFIQNKELGMSLEQVLVLKGPAVKDSTYESTLAFFKNEMAKIEAVNFVAVSSSIPGQEVHWGRSFHRQHAPEASTGCSIIAIDHNYFPLYKTDFVAGQNFPNDGISWRNAIIINETASKALGFGKPLDAIQQVVIWDEGNAQIEKTVIGVVKDFNQQSLRKNIEPVVFSLKKYLVAPWAGEFYSLKMQASDIPLAVEQVEKLWKDTYGENPFDYFFSDEFFDAQYKNDVALGKIVGIFSALAILIASLGLFGLTAYMTVLRTKEIGIRKILGSTPYQIIALLSSSYLKLVLVAIIIACPIGLWVMNEWLSEFAFRIPMTFSVCVYAGLLCFVSAFVTIGVKAWHTANLDPAKALKYE